MNGPVFSVDTPLQFGPLLVGSREVANVLGGKLRVQASDENGRTENLREAGRMMLQWITRRRNRCRLQFQGFRTGNQRESDPLQHRVVDLRATLLRQLSIAPRAAPCSR